MDLRNRRVSATLGGPTESVLLPSSGKSITSTWILNVQPAGNLNSHGRWTSVIELIGKIGFPKEKEAYLRNLELLKKQKKQKKLNIKENKTYKIKKVKTILNHKIIKKIKVKSIELEKLYKVEKNNFLSFLESKDIDLWDKRKKIKEMKNLSYVFLENLIKKELKTTNELNLSNFWGTTKLLNKFNKKDLELENSLINKYNSLLSEDDKKDNMELELRKEINHYYLAEYTIELANKDKININSFKDDTIYVLDR